MNRMFFIVLVLLGSSFSTADQQFWNDDDRGGLYLSFGLGGHSTSFDVVGFEEESNSELGLATSFKLGGYITPQFAIYYQREAGFWMVEEAEDAIFLTGLSGIGATVYAEPYLGMYLEGGLGFGELAVIESGNVEAVPGRAVMLGVGNELTAHSQIGFVYLSGLVEDSGIGLGTSTFAAKLEFKL